MKFQDDSQLRWFLGNIRDLDWLKRPFHRIDYLIHAAGLTESNVNHIIESVAKAISKLNRNKEKRNQPYPD